jgi:hypothetical protein
LVILSSLCVVFPTTAEATVTTTAPAVASAGVTTATTLQPSPSEATASVVFSEDGTQFTGQALLLELPGSKPKFMLRLGAGSRPVGCNAKPLPGSVSSDGQVSEFELGCTATELPSSYSLVLEVFGLGSTPVLLPASFVNNSNAAWVDRAPMVGGLAVALAVAVVAWSWAWRKKAPVLAHDAEEKLQGAVHAAGEARRAGTPAQLSEAEEYETKAYASADAAQQASKRKIPPLLDLKNTVDTDVAWSGSDSWVTNATALASALLLATGAASTSLASVLPGFPAARFEVLSVLFGVLVGLAPVIYGLLATDEERSGPASEAAPKDAKSSGRVIGVLVAGVATLTALVGELALVWFAVTLSTAHAAVRALLYIGVSATFAVMVLFSIKGMTYMLLPQASPLTHKKGSRSGTL